MSPGEILLPSHQSLNPKAEGIRESLEFEERECCLRSRLRIMVSLKKKKTSPPPTNPLAQTMMNFLGSVKSGVSTKIIMGILWGETTLLIEQK